MIPLEFQTFTLSHLPSFLQLFFGTVIHCWRYWAARVADVTQAFQVDTRRRLARNGDLMGMLA